MTKIVYIYCLSALILLVLSTATALAVSITPGYVRLEYQPYAKYDVPFTVGGSTLIDVILEPGDLEGYCTLDDSSPNGTPRMVILHIRLPEALEKPGRNTLYVQAKEVSSQQGAVAVAAVRAPVSIFVPYPGYYAEMYLEAPNINEGEPQEFKVTVTNLGTNRLERVYAVIEVYDAYGQIKTLTTDTVSMNTNDQVTIRQTMATTGLKPGIYRAQATLYYDGGNSLEDEKNFTIGTLYIQINNYTSELEQGKLNRFEVDIENKWNAIIPDVYGIISFEGEDVKTPSLDISALGTGELYGYIDTANQAFGDHDITITVHYADKTTVSQGKVRIVPAIAEKSASEEKPSGVIELKLSVTTILIAVIVLLVIVDVVWLVAKNRSNRPSEGSRAKRRK